MDTTLGHLSFDALAGLAKTKFRVRVSEAEAIELELADVTPRRVTQVGGAKPAMYESFSLIFAGPLDRMLPQRMYAFESETLGQFEMFIVPIGRDEAGFRYEAAFNRRAVGGA